ncbi:sensor histidine kinase [Pedobacter duraquae]|uniref:Histidine kinase n=1 Tax=Pedobacter duraquae TaxID=425511 RepID=A0A4R6IMP2_9SPHI|nr:histidine kinase [Pedobacter duraquae]TDO23361.1 histidine kinase [Pedobacter duraquae]
MTKEKSWFWPVQILIWLIVGLLNYLVQHFNGSFPLGIQIINLVGMSCGGLLVTTIYRFYLKKIRFNYSLRVGKFIGFVLGHAGIQSVCWMGFIMLISLPFVGEYHIRIIYLPFNIVPLLTLVLVWDLGYLTYHIIKNAHLREVEKWKMDAEVQKAQLGSLKAQINPHFMFNTLNNIRSLILEDPQLAREMLTRFSELFRYTLQHSDDRETTVAEELIILRQYLDLVKMQYEEKLQYSIDAGPEVSMRKIPPMVLQLLAENAVKHGIAQSADGGIVAVSVHADADMLQIVVKNTGSLQIARQLEHGLGIGLNNISERLRLLYGNQAKLTIHEEHPFVIVEILILNS